MKADRMKTGHHGYGSGGFTLIELSVANVIIAILAAMLLPVLAKAKQKAQAMQRLGNELIGAVSIDVRGPPVCFHDRSA